MRAKILFADIETAPILANVWQLWDQNVALNQIERDWCVLSWAAKWSHEPSVMYRDQRKAKNIEDDKKLLEGIWKLLDECDILVAQNGKAFDAKKLNARFIQHGMKPPSSYKIVDTMLLAKKHFAFTSNKLEYLSDKLCVKYKKLKHSKFSGFELWKECLAGNIAAWKEMEKYNKYDVLSLEELYHKLAPWDSSVNYSLYGDNTEHICSCGSSTFQKYGFAYTGSGKFQRYQCIRCGSEWRDKKSLIKLEKTGTSR